jgi:hypothetical protein
VGKDAVLKTCLLPALTVGVKNTSVLGLGNAVKDVPLAVGGQGPQDPSGGARVKGCSHAHVLALPAAAPGLRWLGGRGKGR